MSHEDRDAVTAEVAAFREGQDAGPPGTATTRESEDRQD